MTFLKWPGGKKQLLKEIDVSIPIFTGRYIEPFLGGGSVALYILRTRSVTKAILGDANAELIGTFKTVRNNTDALIATLQDLKGDNFNTPEWYYALRNGDLSDKSDVYRAARMIALNKTCFNGLYRVNSKGVFNASFGKYANPVICDEVNLKQDSELLQKADVRLSNFDETLEEARSGDFLYLDPPYVISSKTADFTHFTKERFFEEDLIRLLDICKTFSSKGVRFLMSNSDKAIPIIQQYGFSHREVRMPRKINTDATKRGAVTEILVTNF